VNDDLHRRHLSESQRGMVAAKLANMGKGRPLENGQICLFSQPEAATMLNVSTRTVKSAKAVMEHGLTDLIQSVEQGDIPVSAAAKIAKLTDAEQTEAMGMIASGEVKYADKAVDIAV